MVFVDDDTDVVHGSEADHSSNLLKNNRMCVAGEKSKLLIIGTRQLKASKVVEPMEIEKDVKKVQETRSEKLLGILVNDSLTWHEHLYGETWREGNQLA